MKESISESTRNRLSVGMSTALRGVLEFVLLILIGATGVFKLTPLLAEDLAGKFPTAKVINGENVPFGAFPWMLSLQYSSSSNPYNGHFCGASLISKDLAITAGHCVIDRSKPGIVLRDPSTLRIFHGSNSLSIGSGSFVTVAGVRLHPNFNRDTLENDIALIKLGSNLSAPYLPIAAASDAEYYIPGESTTVIGWGRTSSGFVPVDLQYASFPLQSDANCAGSTTGSGLGTFYKSQVMICAGSPNNKDACNGDSGGPLIASVGGVIKLIGTVSFGIGESCGDRHYGGYTRISAFSEFISQGFKVPPKLISTPQINGIPKTGETLSVSQGSWSSLNSISFSFQWLRDGLPVTGAESSTYTLTTEDEKRFISAVVTARDSENGDAQAETSTVFVTNLSGETDGQFSQLSFKCTAVTGGNARCSIKVFVNTLSSAQLLLSQPKAKVSASEKAKCAKKTATGTKYYQCIKNLALSARVVKSSGGRIWAATFQVKEYKNLQKVGVKFVASRTLSTEALASTVFYWKRSGGLSL